MLSATFGSRVAAYLKVPAPRNQAMRLGIEVRRTGPRGRKVAIVFTMDGVPADPVSVKQWGRAQTLNIDLLAAGRDRAQVDVEFDDFVLIRRKE